ncbi:MAG: hypothetical protein D6731_02455 [Planctomycetota bacterium]|nr:MAG: hypothetical protein D6731_02455 [Planctomycetota bacterium]
MHLDVASRTVTFKLVYYGPGWGGKTTNLEVIHASAPAERRGELLSVSTQGDRTLFFDCVPLELGRLAGFRTRLQLYTVPGQAYYAATRRLVLRGADGVVFVADSAAERLEENRSSLEELDRFLREDEGRSLGEEVPLVFQWNKQDLSTALTPARLAAELDRYGAASVPAVARERRGVLSALRILTKVVLDRARARALSTGRSSSLPSNPGPPGPPAPTLLDEPPAPTRLDEPFACSPPPPASEAEGSAAGSGPVILAVSSADAASGSLSGDFPSASSARGSSDAAAVAADLQPARPCPWSREAVRRPPDKDDGVLGQRVRGCRIHTKLGEGGMGAVYLARHEVLKKDFVVKVLKPGSSQKPRRVRRFLREARLAASVEHPNIVCVQDVGTTDRGLHFILMQYVAGENLRQRIERLGAHPPEEATRIVLSVARALSALHPAGIIHRDVKADNVVLTPSGEVKLIDFGLAKDLGEEGALTLPGAFVGTPAYVAPEVGRVDDVDGRADIYSLGLTYYYLLTGRPPFAGAAVEDILARKVRLEPPSRFAPAIDERHERVLATMLATDREQRYPDARAVVVDLEALLQGAPLRYARPLPRPRRPDAVRPSGQASPEASADQRALPGSPPPLVDTLSSRSVGDTTRLAPRPLPPVEPFRRAALFAGTVLAVALGLGLLHALRRADAASERAARYEALLRRFEDAPRSR